MPVTEKAGLAHVRIPPGRYSETGDDCGTDRYTKPFCLRQEMFAKGWRALRPPRVVFVIGCVSRNTFSHFTEAKMNKRPHKITPAAPDICLDMLC